MNNTIDNIRQLLKAKQFEDANFLIDKALKERSPTADLFNLKGQLLIEIGHLEEAAKIFRKIHIDWPNNFEALNGLALCLIYQKKWDEGIQILSSILKKDPQNEDAREHLSFIKRELSLIEVTHLIEDRKYIEAKKIIEKILQSDKNNTGALLSLAEIHTKEHHFDQASNNLTSVFNFNLNHEEALKKLLFLQKSAEEYHIRAKNDESVKSQKRLISVHIPKCGGSSFLKFLKGYYGDRLYTDYGIEWAIKNRALLSITEKTLCIHGHFRADKYDEIFRAACLVTWVRHPVMRTISHYRFVLKYPASVYKNPTPACKLVQERNLSLVEFAHLPNMKNFLTRYFAGKKLEDFNFIGVVEFYRESLERFCNMTEIPFPSVIPQENVNKPPNEETFDIDKADFEKIAKLNTADCELYQKILDRI